MRKVAHCCVFVAALVIVAGASPAFADIIYLRCGNSSGITFAVDTANRTVDNREVGRVSHANITTTSIDWTDEGPLVIAYNHIDRVNGTYSQRATTKNGSGTFNSPATQCSVMSAPATKF